MRKKIYTSLFIAAFLSVLISCDFQKEADVKFGDQNFKQSIALIELHKIRFGNYPNSLNELKFLGDWDKIYLNGVEYKKLSNGYELNITRGWIGKPELSYPNEFWNGIGLVKSNIKLEK